MDTFYHNTTLALGNVKLLLGFGSRFQNLLICEILLMLSLISLYKLFEHLAFFQAAMSDSCTY